MAKKIFGTKSPDWHYEQEYRIIHEKAGIVTCSEKITGIYFGLRMSNDHKQFIRESLQDHQVNYYQIQHKINSYNLEAIPI
ncbi:hypothetical protein B9T12_03305 [Wohlfahrtiimonas chitiniclastica]|nr:hypothetical protein B9T12_03305 [Wohlfahrtiimonas chitiniclastica]